MSPVQNEAEHERILREAITSCRRSLFLGRGRLYVHLNALADWLSEQKRYAEAEPVYRESLSILRQMPPSQDLVIVLSNLANLYFQQYRENAAEPIYRDALSIARQVLPPDSEHTAYVLSCLTDVYRSLCRYDEALHYCRQACGIYERIYGATHPMVRSSQLKLGGIYRVLENYGAAENVLLKSLESGRAVLPAGDSSLIHLLQTLGEVAREQGDLRQAESYHREALELCEAHLLPHAEERASCYDYLASVAFQRADYAEAERMAWKAIGADTGGGRKATAAHAVHLDKLAQVYQKRFREEEAETLMRQALEIDRQALSPQHHQYGLHLYHLATLLQEQGRFDEAETAFIQVLAIDRKTYPAIHAEIMATLDKLVEVALDQGKYVEGERYLLDAITISRALEPKSNMHLLTQLRDLAHLYHDAEWYDKAEPAYAEAMEMMLHELGADHRDTRLFAKDRIQFDFDRKMAKDEKDEFIS